MSTMRSNDDDRSLTPREREQEEQRAYWRAELDRLSDLRPCWWETWLPVIAFVIAIVIGILLRAR